MYVNRFCDREPCQKIHGPDGHFNSCKFHEIYGSISRSRLEHPFLMVVRRLIQRLTVVELCICWGLFTKATASLYLAVGLYISIIGLIPIGVYVI